MSLRIGLDLLDTDEVQDSLRVHGRRYLERVYTVGELKDCAEDPRGLAMAFAVKEATMKALGRERDDAIPWQAIEVRRGRAGAMSVELHGAAAELAARRGVSELSVSMARSGELSGAVVLAEVP